MWGSTYGSRKLFQSFRIVNPDPLWPYHNMSLLWGGPERIRYLLFVWKMTAYFSQPNRGRAMILHKIVFNSFITIKLRHETGCFEARVTEQIDPPSGYIKNNLIFKKRFSYCLSWGKRWSPLFPIFKMHRLILFPLVSFFIVYEIIIQCHNSLYQSLSLCIKNG